MILLQARKWGGEVLSVIICCVEVSAPIRWESRGQNYCSDLPEIVSVRQQTILFNKATHVRLEETGVVAIVFKQGSSALSP